jgi:serine/threonine-protein kinase HipA
MATRENKLVVFANIGAQWAPCGQLILTESSDAPLASTFAYGTNYLKRDDAIEVDPVSLSISDRSAIAGKRLLPQNRLPYFGGIRDAAPDSWGRRVIEAKLKAPANSLPESQYLLHAGGERVGALDVRSDMNTQPLIGANNWNTLAHLMEAAERIDEGLPVPAHLDAIFLDGSALGGARPKASVRDDADVLWLAKFSSRQDGFDMPAIECASLQLARKAGLNVPPVQMMMLGDRRIMLIRRFDRYWAASGAPMPEGAARYEHGAGDGRVERRSAFVSGLTLVGCDESESRVKSYADLADSIRRYCHQNVIRLDSAELYTRMIYNIFVSNDDDHLRNHGFLWDDALRGWRLSPLYDVLPRPSHASERQLHLGVGAHGRMATLDNALSWCERFNLTEKAACERIAQVWQVVREWRVYFDEFGVDAKEMHKVQSAFRHIDDIASPALLKRLP